MNDEKTLDEMTDVELSAVLQDSIQYPRETLKAVREELARRDVARLPHKEPVTVTAVTITGVRIPFGDLVVLLFKITLAWVPVVVFLWILGFIISGVFGVAIFG